MNEAMESRHVTSDDEASCLLPGSDDEETLYLVLFCEEGAPAVDKARRIAPRVDVPQHWEFARLNREQAPEAAEQFGVSEVSGTAVVRDGSLLSIEYECSLEAFRRLIRGARQQSETRESLG